VRPYDRRLIHESLTRELARGGQVFFVHNFVQSIEAMASEVQSIVPDARIVFGHGQMKPAQLEKVMDQFVRHEADILVSTAIIESGIDIPNANTMIINRADRFGLADLHQLRGRVGRSHHRGYCYLLTPANKPIQPKAVKRLKAIEEFSDLGAGFRIAMRDLEIRGAGNILGVEQSGHIAAVGYEMYCQLLEKAVRKLKGEKPTDAPRVHLELGVVAHIPQKYIQSPRARIEIYRRLAACRLHAEVEQLEADLTDAFGRPPAPVYQLIRLAEIRALARRWSIESIILREPDVVFAVKKLADAETAFKDAAGSVRLPDANTIYWRPPSAYLDTETLLTVLKKMLSRRVAAKVPA
jgi:transcription-repair coupling factor (superfamily II helicase)